MDMMLKNVKNQKQKPKNIKIMENLKHWKTTTLGLLTVIISILVGFGILKPGDVQNVNNLGMEIITAVFDLIVGVTGLVAIFKAKDK